MKISLSSAFLVMLVGVIYYLRNNHEPMGKFLEGPLRKLAEGTIVEQVCDGVNTNNTFTEKETKRAKTFRESLKKLRDGNPLLEFIDQVHDQSKASKEYLVPLLKFATIWFVFFGISVLGFMGYSINWCCMYCKCCKKVATGKLNCCAEPKKPRWKIFLLFGSIAFSCCVVGGSLTGIILSGTVPSGARKTACGIVTFLQEVADGRPEDKWIGIDQAVDQIGTILDIFDPIVNNLTNISTDYTALDNSVVVAKSSINILFTAADGQSAIRPDPEIGGTYLPTYIKNNGPPSLKTTYTGAIQDEIVTKQTNAEATATSLNSSISLLKNQQQGVKGLLTSGQQLAQAISTQINSTINNIGSFSKTIDRATNGVGIILMSVFVTSLVVALIALGAIILIVICKLKYFSKFVHISWMLMGLFMIFAWGLSILLFPSSVALMETCEVFDTMVQNPSFFNKTLETFAPGEPETRLTLYVCLHGNGDIIQRFGITDQLAIFEGMFATLNQSTGIYNADQTKIVKSVQIPSQLNMIQNIRIGRYSDSNESSTDLAKLNGLTHSTTNVCPSNLDDTWVLNSLNCTAGSIFQIGDGDQAYLSQKVCIGFNIWISNGNLASGRYSTLQYPQPACGQKNGVNMDSYIISFINTFISNRNRIATLHGTLESKLIDVQTANDNYMVELLKVTQNFDEVNKTINGVREPLFNTDNGLLTNGKCNYISKAIQKLSDTMCIGLITGIYQTTICIIIVSFFTFFGSFFLFCVAKKLGIRTEEDVIEERKRLLRKQTTIG